MLKRIVKVIAFTLIFAILFLTAQTILAGNEDVRDSKRIKGYYNEKEGALDAVFIGSSNTYAFWMAPYAWREFGIAVYPYAASSMPVEPIRFIVEECRKTQKDALYIINVSSLHDDRSTEHLSYIFNEMPLNMTKLRAISYTSKSLEFTREETMELFFPMLRFHDRWYEVGRQDIYPVDNGYKGGNTYNGFFEIGDVAPSLVNEGNIVDLPENLVSTLNDLVDYLEAEKVNFMFVIVPQAIDDQRKYDYQNSARKILEDRGYEVLNMHDLTGEIGIDYDTDYYNEGHTNHHGSIKVTNYLAKYLMEHYGFEDKRGNPEYADWDKESADYYSEVLASELFEADMKYFAVPPAADAE